MLNSAPARWAFSAMSALFGGLGLFFLYLGSDDPSQLLPGLIFLTSAIGIVLSAQYSGERSTDRTSDKSSPAPRSSLRRLKRRQG